MLKYRFSRLPLTYSNYNTTFFRVSGCLGNSINLLALHRSKLRMKKTDGGKDSGTHLGLFLLAISDMLFCMAIFPRALVDSGTTSLFPKRGFQLYYQVLVFGYTSDIRKIFMPQHILWHEKTAIK